MNANHRSAHTHKHENRLHKLTVPCTRTTQSEFPATCANQRFPERKTTFQHGGSQNLHQGENYLPLPFPKHPSNSLYPPNTLSQEFQRIASWNCWVWTWFVTSWLWFIMVNISQGSNWRNIYYSTANFFTSLYIYSLYNRSRRNLIIFNFYINSPIRVRRVTVQFRIFYFHMFFKDALKLKYCHV
jgi:hypothetical protein